MTAELAIYQPGTLAAQMDYAKAMAASDLLPRAYQGKPANLLWAISYGQTLGVAPLTAVQSIHVINGKPTASADLIAGLVRRAGHKLRVNGDDRRAIAQIIRADDPDFTFEAVWTIERAQSAKLTGKDTWKNFPAAMLKARAITEVARAACSEILQGTIYTPEELGANVDADGVPVEAEVTQLHRVQPGENDPWAAAEPLAPAREFLREALDAPDAATVRRIWLDARAAGAVPEYLEQIADAGRKKPAAPVPEAGEQEVLDVETVDEAPSDPHAAAVTALRAFAAENGISDADLDMQAHGALGAPLNDVSAEAIWGLLNQLTAA
ncbi:hypothetical protein [Streptomyces sp. NPDC013740]|uniref:hypothetical protein n=1 Tax=Streptomyces sp. NPDC013740 TaxID=3364867 RepID=UPI003700F441